MDASTHMISSRLGILLLAMGLLAGCGSGPSKLNTQVSSRPVAQATAATVSYCADDCTAGSDTFAINSVSDLNVVVGWRNLAAGTHLQELTFYTPAGDRYQSLQAEFDTAKQAREGGLPTVRTVLPISGTWIQQRAMGGEWKVEVSLDRKLVTSSTLHLQ